MRSRVVSPTSEARQEGPGLTPGAQGLIGAEVVRLRSLVEFRCNV